VAAVARSTQAWAKPVENPGEGKAGWLQAAGARRREARAKQRACLGREWLKEMRRAIAKQGDLWRAGGISQVIRPLLRRRHTGVLVTVMTADGRLPVRPGKVQGKSPGRLGVGSSLLKAAPREVHEVLLRLYNACLRLKVTPSAWRRELISPILKQPGSDRVDLLRPIKLLEVTRKAACGIVKDRVRAAVEGAKILDYRQYGGRRGGGSTYSAVTSVARAFEDAITRRLASGLHLLSVDCRIAPSYALDRDTGRCL
jgi:hypothetical protein